MEQSGQHSRSVDDKDGGSHCNVIIVSLVADDCSCLGLPVKKGRERIDIITNSLTNQRKQV